MPGGELNWGADATDAKFRTLAADDGTQFVLVEDSDVGTILLEWDDTAGEFVSRGPLNMSSNDLSNVGSMDATAVTTAQVSNVHFLPEWSGSSLDAKWDNLRATFGKGEPNIVFVPAPSDGSEAGAITDGSGDPVGWAVDNPLVVDDPENATTFVLGATRLRATSPINQFWHFGPTNKTERIRIIGGEYDANGGNATRFALAEGVARLIWYHPAITDFNAGSFTEGFVAEANTSPSSVIRLHDPAFDKISGAAVRFSGTTHAINYCEVDGLICDGDDGLHVEGNVQRFRASVYEDAGNQLTNSVIRLSATADGTPRRADLWATGSSGITGVLTEDTTGGSADRIARLNIWRADIDGPGATQFDLDWITTSKVHQFNAFGSAILRSGSFFNHVASTGINNGVRSFVTDNGDRNKIGGVNHRSLGGSAPDATTFNDGDMVADTDNAGDVYLIYDSSVSGGVTQIGT